MNLIKKDKLNIIVENNYEYAFEIQESGTCLIEIIASAKSWWQNFKNLKSFFQDDGLTLKIDDIEFPKLNGKKGLFDGEVAWNGNNLKGLSKTNIFLINLNKGAHSLNFSSDKNPILESIAIYKIDETEINYFPEKNNPAQDGNRRQWMTLIPVNVFVKKLNIIASAKKYPENKDDDDIKLIIDGNIQKNETDKSHKNWFWCGRILNGQEKELNRELNFEPGLHYIELWADGMPAINSMGLNFVVNIDEKENSEREKIKKYIYAGTNDEYDYNRYDKIICDVVDYWNNEFLNDLYPVETLLDPSLVKAMIYQESKMGYYPGGEVNIMQVGNSGDPSLLTLNGELTEYWMQNGQEEKLDYNGKANADTPYDSVYWGVRWLYHKAQGIMNEKRYWRSWKEAVNLYGPPKKEYVENIWSIYINGIDKQKPNKIIKLWSLGLLIPWLLLSSFFCVGENKMTVNRESAVEENISGKSSSDCTKPESVEVIFKNKKDTLFAAVSIWQKDWWEEFEFGNYLNGKIEQIKIDNEPTDQSISSVRFLDLKGFANPIAEVYGQTHAGHGFFYLYEISGDKAKLILKFSAVDINNDIRWSPDNLKKYGHGSCGEVFAGGKLESNYKDLNKDGISDVILSGAEEIICESYKINSSDYTEIKIAENPVEKVFSWDDSAKGFVPESK